VIRSATKFGGWFPVDQATAQEPFAAFFHMVGVKIRSVVVAIGSLCTLPLNHGNRYQEDQDGWQHSQ
jgi:hypothetical protein